MVNGARDDFDYDCDRPLERLQSLVDAITKCRDKIVRWMRKTRGAQENVRENDLF